MYDMYILHMYIYIKEGKYTLLKFFCFPKIKQLNSYLVVGN